MSTMVAILTATAKPYTLSSLTRSLPVGQAAGCVTMADAEGNYKLCRAPATT